MIQHGMGGRAVEGTGLENRQGCKPLVGSNPTPSASKVWWAATTTADHGFERVLMSGRSRLPGGEPRKASQRRTRRGEAPAPVKLNWRPGERVRWNDRDGVFQRDLGDGENAEIKLGDRVYRVRLSELA